MISATKEPSIYFRRLFARIACGVFLLLTASPAMAEQRSGDVYGLPPCVTVSGERIDFIFWMIFWLTAVVFVLVQGTYIYYLIRYRHRPGVKAHYSHGHNTLELVWTTLPTIIFLALAIYSNRIWDEIHLPAPKNALTIDVSAYQFGWQMRYPGISGKLADSDVKLISTQDPFGTYPNDPAAAQDVISPEMVIPVGRPVHVLLHSRDVIHAFYVPEFRLYQDCVPGRTIGWVWFQATQTGDFQLACNQLCGTGHYNMKAPIHIVTEQEFNQWLSTRQKKNAAAAASPPAKTAASPTQEGARLTASETTHTL